MTPIINRIKEIAQSRSEECQRVFHGRGQCFPGWEWITVDWYKPLFWICLFREPDFIWWQEFSEALHSAVGDLPVNILVQHRYLNHQPVDVIYGKSISKLVATEDGLNFQVKFGEHQNTGLFLDMQNGRRWVKAHSQNARVLNLFSYTCGFSVAAIAGGATCVINVDSAKSALAWGRDNHRLNHQALDKVRFLPHDVLRSWGKLRKLGPFDLVIIDPPSFQKGSFIAAKDYRKLGKHMADLLVPDGELLACLNAPELSCRFLQDAIENPPLVWQERLPNPETFPEVDPDKGLKVMRFKKLP